VRRAAVLGVLAALLAAGAARAAPSPGLVEAGQHLFGRYCATCHGGNGQGIDPPRRRAAGGGPGREQTLQTAGGPDLRGVGALAADFYLRTGYMPLPELGVQPKRRSHLLFTDGQIDALTAYVASLGPGPAIPTPHPERGNLSEGMQAFTSHCAGCHQVAAAGGYVTGGVAPPLDRATPRQIAEAVRLGPYLMPRFSRRAISDAELDSIVRWVQYTKHPDNRGGWSLGHVGPVPEGLVTWFVGIAFLLACSLALGRRLKA
jgi:ubiquinol-cytochrome c reductase cytochrome c subunit